MLKKDILVPGTMLVYPADAAITNSILTTAMLNDAIAKLKRMDEIRLSLDAEVTKRRPFQEKDGTAFDFRGPRIGRLQRTGR